MDNKIWINHVKIEKGIPIPEKDLYTARPRGRVINSERTIKLMTLKRGKSIRINLYNKDANKERSRYTATIAKHRKKFNWKFVMKTTKTCLTIRRLK